MHRFPVVTWALVAACFVGLALQQGAGDGFVERWAMVHRGFTWATDWPRLFTSVFLHGGWGHLLGNLYFLVVFGDNVEDRLGRGWFLALFAASGFLANLVDYAAAPDREALTLGASGAIAGVLGAYMVFFPTERVRVAGMLRIGWPVMRIRVPAFLFLGGWLLLQLVHNELGTARVAWWAHIGGFLAGALLAVAARLLVPDARLKAIVGDLAQQP